MLGFQGKRVIKMDKKITITIARGFGTGGKQIASKVAEKLGIECYEHRILTMASYVTERDEKDLFDMDERLNGSYLKNKIRQLPKSLSPRAESKSFVSDSQLYDIQATIIRRLADSESCVIVGKCADYLLRDRDNVLSVYIEAPRAFCVKRIMERMDISEKEANKKISETDKHRAAYYKFYTDGNYWTNPVNYDMTLNSARLGIDGCVNVILDALKEKFGIME